MKRRIIIYVPENWPLEKRREIADIVLDCKRTWDHNHDKSFQTIIYESEDFSDLTVVRPPINDKHPKQKYLAELLSRLKSVTTVKEIEKIY
jgi:hypothetical protein